METLKKKTYYFYNNEKSNILNQNGIGVHYYEIDKVINNHLHAKNYIIDLRDCSKSQIEYLMQNLKQFQQKFLSKIFFNENKNLTLSFLLSQSQHWNKILDEETIKEIKYDFEYAKKEFITENDLKELENKEHNIKLNVNPSTILYEGKELKLTHFNLIYGNNTSGKTRLLNHIAENLETPVFDLALMASAPMCAEIKKNITNKDLETSYYRKLMEKEQYDYSWISYYCDSLSNGLSYTYERALPLALDNLSFERLDGRHLLNTIDTLADFSLNKNHPVIMTSASEHTKCLVKQRVYNPNIIEL